VLRCNTGYYQIQRLPIPWLKEGQLEKMIQEKQEQVSEEKMLGGTGIEREWTLVAQIGQMKW